MADLQNIDQDKVNFLDKTQIQTPGTAKVARKAGRFLIYSIVVLLLTVFVFTYKVFLTDTSIGEIFSNRFFNQLNIFTEQKTQLKGASDDRINILLSGMGGKGHEGPYLTDTILLVSIKPSTKKVAMMSIPRDLMVEIPGYGSWKINNANSFGEGNGEGQGAVLLKQVVEETFNLPIHYYGRIDFSGFEQIIDDLGGVKVFVENSFTDYSYPTDDYKYQTIYFEKGWQTMDGNTALKFARSRHGNNGEGSDFARGKRQQKIIQAVKDRMFSYNFLLSPTKISRLYKGISDHIATDIEITDLISFATLAEQLDTANIISLTLDDGPGGLLYADKINGSYVLLGRGGDFNEIRTQIQNIFQEKNAAAGQIVKFEIKNGTKISGLASRNSEELKAMGYRITDVANSPLQNYEKTEIYKISSRDLTHDIDLLEKKYSAIVQTTNIPTWISDTVAPDVDFVIILGRDADE